MSAEGYVTPVERWKAACTVECGWSQIHLSEEAAYADLFRHRAEWHAAAASTGDDDAAAETHTESCVWRRAAAATTGDAE